jgi:hypothetical protein
MGGDVHMGRSAFDSLNATRLLASLEGAERLGGDNPMETAVGHRSSKRRFVMMCGRIDSDMIPEL